MKNAQREKEWVIFYGRKTINLCCIYHLELNSSKNVLFTIPDFLFFNPHTSSKIISSLETFWYFFFSIKWSIWNTKKMHFLHLSMKPFLCLIFSFLHNRYCNHVIQSKTIITKRYLVKELFLVITYDFNSKFIKK